MMVLILTFFPMHGHSPPSRSNRANPLHGFGLACDELACRWADWSFVGHDAGGELFEAPWFHVCVGPLVNVTHLFPFIILAVAIIPFTRLIAGTSGWNNSGDYSLDGGGHSFFGAPC